MNSILHNITGIVLIGIGATALMDVWSVVLRRAFNIPSLNFCLVGRWIGHMRFGRFAHTAIGKAAPQPGECTIGWIAHYLIGITFALVLVVLAPGQWLAAPSITPALLVGLGTVVMPYFIMQPALGLGIAASKTPNPSQARLKSLVSHGVFGIGLYLSALLLLVWK